MQTLRMGQAINQALREEMLRDPDVFLAGEGIGVGIHHSPLLPTAGLLKDFGAGRVKDTPVSEAAIAGLAVGPPMDRVAPSQPFDLLTDRRKKQPKIAPITPILTPKRPL
jgi:pyruvate dehydrogenase E1 component beta subunit